MPGPLEGVVIVDLGRTLLGEHNEAVRAWLDEMDRRPGPARADGPDDTERGE